MKKMKKNKKAKKERERETRTQHGIFKQKALENIKTSHDFTFPSLVIIIIIINVASSFARRGYLGCNLNALVAGEAMRKTKGKIYSTKEEAEKGMERWKTKAKQYIDRRKTRKTRNRKKTAKKKRDALVCIYIYMYLVYVHIEYLL